MKARGHVVRQSDTAGPLLTRSFEAPAAVLCLVCRKRRSSARLNSEDDWQAQWSQVSGAQTPAGGAVELHQVGVRNPMADDREKGFSDVNL